MFDHKPNRCPHHTLDTKIIDHFRTEYYCVACGEQVGWVESETQSPDLYVSGEVRKLSKEEKEELR